MFLPLSELEEVRFLYRIAMESMPYREISLVILPIGE